MTMATLQSSSPSNPPPTQSLTIETNPLRDLSFSSYLNNNTTEESSFVLKLAGSSTTTAQKTLRDHDHDHLIWGTKKAKDREIGVFGAERYFNEDQMDNKYPHVINKDAERVVKPMVLLRSVGTPSVRSESSMNSQSVLLKRNLAGGSKANKVHGKSFFSSIAGCKCVCSDKHSVDIDDGNKSDKAAAAAAGNNCGSVHKMPLVQTSSFDMAEITKPLSQSWSMNDKVINHIRSNSSSHGLTASVQIPSANNGINNINNGDELSDNQSDTSSDLFEIESLTGKAANPNLSRQASEGLMSPTNGYAPSEASIEWSVVTASVADFSLDQFRSANFTRNDSKSFRSAVNGNNNVMNKELNRRRSGNFMSCKSHKAVRVAGDEYRTRMPHKVPAQGQGASGNLPRGSHMLYI